MGNHSHRIGITRREMLQVGYSGLLGLGLSSVLGGGVAAAATERRQARSVIIVFLTGAPSHIDMFDMKPEAPAEIRGEFRPIATRLPGVQVCEHLPLLACRADKYAITLPWSVRRPLPATFLAAAPETEAEPSLANPLSAAVADAAEVVADGCPPPRRRSPQKPTVTAPPNSNQGCRSTWRPRSKACLTLPTVSCTVSFTVATVSWTASCTLPTVSLTAAAASCTISVASCTISVASCTVPVTLRSSVSSFSARATRVCSISLWIILDSRSIGHSPSKRPRFRQGADCWT
ncbi:MAG: DUF1501 domain-containing protein [Planctomycetes bacterium]|nr:DUF1501 domain-containing protein [Planctomycetota bacterium]